MSVFNLASSPAELPSFNANMSRMIYEQYPPLRDISGNNFPNGQIDIRFEVSGTKWWIPSRTYLRMRARLFRSIEPNVPLTLNDGIAPNMGLMANLFTSAELQIAGKTVSRISELMPQVDALDKRMSKSKSWLDGIGKLNWWQPEQVDRVSNIASTVIPIDASFGYVATDTIQIVVGTATAEYLLTWVNTAGSVDFIAAGSPGRLFPGDVIEVVTAFGGYALGEQYEVIGVATALTATVKLLSAGVIAARGAADPLATGLVVNRGSNLFAQRGGFEMIWQPPLGLFKVPHALPAGQYRLLLNPKPSSEFQISAIESRASDALTLSAPADFRFVVDNMYLYVNTVESVRVDDKTYFLSLDEIRCQTDNVLPTGSLQQRFFDVSPSTYGLALAFQDQDITTDTRRSASKYKIRAAADTPGGADLYLSRLYLNYGGVQKPQPDADPSFVTPDNYLSQLYATSNLYSGMYFDSGGPESEEDWRDRGPYYYYAWPRDGTSESTRVTCNYQFTPPPVANEGRVLLFDLSHKVVMITIKDGRVTDVQSQDA